MKNNNYTSFFKTKPRKVERDTSVAENAVEIWNGLNTIRRKSNVRSADIRYILSLMNLTAMRLRIRRRTQNEIVFLHFRQRQKNR